MNELSRQETMCASTDLLRGEIDRACRNRWGQPTNLREVAVFAHGPAHAFSSMPEVRFHAPSELDVDDETHVRIERHFTAEMEKALVTGPRVESRIKPVAMNCDCDHIAPNDWRCQVPTRPQHQSSTAEQGATRELPDRPGCAVLRD